MLIIHAYCESRNVNFGANHHFSDTKVGRLSALGDHQPAWKGCLVAHLLPHHIVAEQPDGELIVLRRVPSQSAPPPSGVSFCNVVSCGNSMWTWHYNDVHDINLSINMLLLSLNISYQKYCYRSQLAFVLIFITRLYIVPYVILFNPEQAGIPHFTTTAGPSTASTAADPEAMASSCWICGTAENMQFTHVRIIVYACIYIISC